MKTRSVGTADEIHRKQFKDAKERQGDHKSFKESFTTLCVAECTVQIKDLLETLQSYERRDQITMMKFLFSAACLNCPLHIIQIITPYCVPMLSVMNEALWACVKSDRLEIVEYFFETVNQQHKCFSKATKIAALCEAIHKTNLEMIHYLLNQEIDLALEDFRVLSVCMDRNKQIFEMMVDYCFARPHYSYQTAFLRRLDMCLVDASRTGKIDLVKCLVEKYNRKPPQSLGYGDNALHCAYNTGKLEIIKYFSSQGVVLQKASLLSMLRFSVLSHFQKKQTWQLGWTTDIIMYTVQTQNLDGEFISSLCKTCPSFYIYMLQYEYESVLQITNVLENEEECTTTNTMSLDNAFSYIVLKNIVARTLHVHLLHQTENNPFLKKIE